MLQGKQDQQPITCISHLEGQRMVLKESYLQSGPHAGPCLGWVRGAPASGHAPGGSGAQRSPRAGGGPGGQPRRAPAPAARPQMAALTLAASAGRHTLCSSPDPL